jgi:hypothetical protein
MIAVVQMLILKQVVTQNIRMGSISLKIVLMLQEPHKFVKLMAASVFKEKKMGREKEISKFFLKDGLKDTWEGITRSDRSAADRISKGVLGIVSMGIGATVGLVGLGIDAAKKASKDKDSSCKQCGSKLIENTNFCANCGCKI